MGNIKPLYVGDLWLSPAGKEQELCLYVTLMGPPNDDWCQLSKDLGLSKDDKSLLLAMTMPGWIRAPHIPTLECFSVEVVVKCPIDLNDLPFVDDPRIAYELLKALVFQMMVIGRMHEVCRQRVFRHSERACHGNMVRVSALKPGVPLLERIGSNEDDIIRFPSGYSIYEKIEAGKLLIPGMMLMQNNITPFESVIHKPRKPSHRDPQAPDFSRLLEFYDQVYGLFERAKKTLKTLEHCSVEEQRAAISSAYKEIGSDLVERMLSGDRYLSTPSNLAAEWAGQRCGLPVNRDEGNEDKCSYPVSYLQQVLSEQRALKNEKQTYFVKNTKSDEVK